MKKLICLYAAVLVLGAACSNKEQFIRPANSEPFETTPDRLARGAYLVNNVAVCTMCHSGRVGSEMIDPIDPEQYLAGFNIEIPGLIQVSAPNITSSMDGLGDWSDDEIARAIRDGVRNDGSLMGIFMPFYDYKRFSDEDIKSIVVYLRALPKVERKTTPVETQIAFPMNILFGVMNFHSEPARDVPDVDRSDKIAYGEYLAHVGHCGACHSAMPGKTTGDPEFLSGNPEGETLPGVGFVAAKNLTPHKELGIGKYTPEQVKEAIRNGTRLDGKPFAPPMSIVAPHYSAMTEEDLDALTAYLFSLPPQAVQIPDRVLTPEGEKRVREGVKAVLPEGAAVGDAPVEDGETPPPVEDGETPPPAPDGETPPPAPEGEAEPAAAEGEPEAAAEGADDDAGDDAKQ